MTIEWFRTNCDRFWHAVAARFRARRRRQFLALFPPTEVTSILDVGGIASLWPGESRPVVVLNLQPQETHEPCRVLVGDGRKMEFADQSFDLAYSNSAIEHVGPLEDQRAFAAEMQRVGRSVYCQTPNRWFPVDVHYLALFWNWMPALLRNYFVVRFLTGWGWLNRPDREMVGQYADSVHLLDARQMEALFPGSTIFREKFLGMTKSLIAVKKARKESGAAKLLGETSGIRLVESSGQPLWPTVATLSHEAPRPVSETRG